MTTEQLQYVGFAMQALNLVVLPIIIGVGKYLIRVEKRLLLIEAKLGLPLE